MEKKKQNCLTPKNGKRKEKEKPAHAVVFVPLEAEKAEAKEKAIMQTVNQKKKKIHFMEKEEKECPKENEKTNSAKDSQHFQISKEKENQRKDEDSAIQAI